MCSAVSLPCSVEPITGLSLEPDMLTARPHFSVSHCLVVCTFSWILLFLFFVILTKHQKHTLDFTITVGCKFISLLNSCGGLGVYEGGKYNSGSMKWGLHELRIGEYKMRICMWVNVLFVGRSCRACWAKDGSDSVLLRCVK